jgi:hypothetical protein
LNNAELPAPSVYPDVPATPAIVVTAATADPGAVTPVIVIAPANASTSVMPLTFGGGGVLILRVQGPSAALADTTIWILACVASVTLTVPGNCVCCPLTDIPLSPIPAPCIVIEF